MKRTVSDLIRQKGLADFKSVRPETTIYDALSILKSDNNSAILVIKGKELYGIFSEKDFARASLKRSVGLSSKIDSVMTSTVYYVKPTFTLEECLQVMHKVHVRHLPVLENGYPIALISMRHIMEVLVEDKESKIQELLTYITGHSLNADFSQDKVKDQEPLYIKSINQEAV